MHGSQPMAPDAEEILHDTVNRRKPLELSGRFETPHLALPLSGRLVGDLRAGVRVLIGAVKYRRHHRATGGRVAAQLVGDQGRCCMNTLWGWGRASWAGCASRIPNSLAESRLEATWRGA